MQVNEKSFYSNFIILSLGFNFFLHLFLYNMSVELKSLITNQIVITEKLHLLNNDLVLLKFENNNLCEQLNLMKASKFQALDIANAEPIIPSLLNEQNLFLAKVIFIVAAVLLLSFLIHFFSTSVYTWFYKSIILKFMIIVDSC